LGAGALPLFACSERHASTYEGGWVGSGVEMGHRLRDLKSGTIAAPAVQRRAQTLVVGSGVSGLTCMRALGPNHDAHLFDLENTAGGNSRGHNLGGIACPLGAHYLPVPGENATELLEFLTSLNVCQFKNGHHVFDERYLCHSPQERLFINGQWQEGLLPVVDQSPATLAQYSRFGAAVSQASIRLGFGLPAHRTPWSAGHAALDAITFGQWLAEQNLNDSVLLAYLDYCCRDDYGAGAQQVSAWAGVHYFASRHGFHAPGEQETERDGVLTWPQGNGWLTERMAQPLQGRLHTGMLALRVEPGRHEVNVDFWNAQASHVERWTAPQVVLATPIFISARLLTAPPAALVEAQKTMQYAPWLVANLQLNQALDDPPGAPPSWDNVIHQSALLGYVDAMHQSLRAQPGPTVLTAYWALGGNSLKQLQTARAQLFNQPWQHWAEQVVRDFLVPHPDLKTKLRRIELMRYGHAMSIPLPGVRGSVALKALMKSSNRVHFAHSDLSGYSVFEEAFFHGTFVARNILNN
jgi:hypothetical protein